MNAESPIVLLVGAILMGGAIGLTVHWLLPFWDRFAIHYVRDLTLVMEDLELTTDFVPVLLRWWLVTMLAVLVLIGFVFNSLLLAIPVVVVVFQTPRQLLQGLISRRRRILRDQLVSGSRALANATRAGLPLPMGLEAILPETPAPLASIFRRLVNDFQYGRPFAESLRETRDRLKVPVFTLFASALLVCLERGGKVTEALDRIAHSLQENQRLERKLEAETASGRRVLQILVVCPVMLLALFYLMDPLGTTLLFTTLAGQIVLFVAAVLVYLAVLWSRVILKIGQG